MEFFKSVLLRLKILRDAIFFGANYFRIIYRDEGMSRIMNLSTALYMISCDNSLRLMLDYHYASRFYK